MYEEEVEVEEEEGGEEGRQDRSVCVVCLCVDVCVCYVFNPSSIGLLGEPGD